MIDLPTETEPVRVIGGDCLGTHILDALKAINE